MVRSRSGEYYDRERYNRYRNGSVNRAQAERVRQRGRNGEPCGRCGKPFSPDTMNRRHHPMSVTCGHPDTLPVAWRTDGKRYQDTELRPEHLSCNASDGATIRRDGRINRNDEPDTTDVPGTSREW